MAVIRESVSEFITGDCWGYPKFMHIEDLYKEGYLTDEKEKLVIKFYVRAPFYSQQANDQERYIKTLENKINEMQEKLAEYEKGSKEKGVKVDNKSKHEILEIQNIEEEKKIVIEDEKEINSLDDIFKNIEIVHSEKSQNEEDEVNSELSQNDNENPALSSSNDEEVLKEISNKYDEEFDQYKPNDKEEDEKDINGSLDLSPVIKGYVSARESPNSKPAGGNAFNKVNNTFLISNPPKNKS